MKIAWLSLCPTKPIVAQAGKTYVWVVATDSMTVSKREVMVQDGIGENLVITSGLEAGETIVGAGAHYLAQGMQVRRWDKS